MALDVAARKSAGDSGLYNDWKGKKPEKQSSDYLI